MTIEASEMASLQRHLAYYVGPIARHLLRVALTEGAALGGVGERLAADLRSDDRREFLAGWHRRILRAPQ